jgi:hypothetical protein
MDFPAGLEFAMIDSFVRTLIEGLFSAIFEVLFTGTGRLLFGLFGKRPIRWLRCSLGWGFGPLPEPSLSAFCHASNV